MSVLYSIAKQLSGLWSSLVSNNVTLCYGSITESIIELNNFWYCGNFYIVNVDDVKWNHNDVCTLVLYLSKKINCSTIWLQYDTIAVRYLLAMNLAISQDFEPFETYWTWEESSVSILISILPILHIHLSFINIAIAYWFYFPWALKYGHKHNWVH